LRQGNADGVLAIRGIYIDPIRVRRVLPRMGQFSPTINPAVARPSR
jgi:hypothetical protein